MKIATDDGMALNTNKQAYSIAVFSLFFKHKYNIFLSSMGIY